MKFPKSFTYIFEDPDWLSKIILPMLCSLIPIIGPLVMAGYTLHLIRNVANREPLPLPELDFGKDLARGFKWFVVMLIYAIPLFLLAALMIIPVSVSSNNESAPVLAILLSILCGGAIIAYFIVLWLFMPVAQAHFAMQETISSGFAVTKFAKMFSKNITEWMLVLAGGLLAAMIAPVGSILFFIGALITSTYAGLMISHLIGQAYSVSTQGGPYRANTATYAPQPPYSQAYSSLYYQTPATPDQSNTPVDEHQPYDVILPEPQEPSVIPVEKSEDEGKPKP